MRRPAALAAAVAAPVVSLICLAGCSSSGGPTHAQEQRQVAKKQWAGARAGVMGNMAKEQYENGNFDKCRQTLDEAQKMDPESAPLRMLSAKLAIEQGNLELADRELVQARRFDPKNAEADYLS